MNLLDNTFTSDCNGIGCYWKIDFIEEMNVVHVKSQGMMDHLSLTRLVTECLEEAAKKNVRKFLIDHRRMIPKLSTVSILQLSEHIAGIGTRMGNRIALLYPEQKYCKEDFGFFETAARNRGLMVQLFEDQVKALNWLNQCSGRIT